MSIDKYSLTTPQQNIYNETKFYSDTALGNIGGTLEFSMEGLTSEIIEKAINLLIDAAEGLRLRITENDGEVYQYVSEHEYESITVIDAIEMTNEQIDEHVSALMRTPITYDGKLYRFEILKKADSWLIVAVMHHIVSDAWSMTVIDDAILHACHALVNGEEPVLNIAPYTDVVAKEQEYFASKKYQKDKAFWSEMYAEHPEYVRLKPNAMTSTTPSANRLYAEVSPALSAQIKTFCIEHEYSPATVFEAAMLIYLDRINGGGKTPSLGLAVLNRDGAKDKRTLGMFISTIPLTAKPSEDKTLGELCAEINDLHLQIFRHQKYPYSHILSDIHQHHGDVEKLFDVMMSYQNAQIDAESNVRSKWYTNGNSEVALAFHIDDRDHLGVYKLNLDYQTEQFPDEAEVALLKDRILCIVEQITAKSDMTIADVDILPESEKELLIHTFNDTDSPYPRDKCVHTLFAEQVQKTPDKVAVVCDERTLTYTELDHMSNNLASVLKIDVGDVVALHMHRSELIMVTQLAVLKLGGIFLPIDLSVPTERINDILEDCQAKYFIISDEEKDIAINDSNIQILNIDSLTLDRARSRSVSSAVTANMGAHIIYTSGSTGKPKGSILTHGGLVNFAYHNLVIYPGKCTYDNSISINTISFDMFLCETITPIVVGITVHIATEKQQVDQALFAEYVKKHNIQILQTTPTRYKILTADKTNLDYLDTFKAMLLSGEPFTSDIYYEMRSNSHAHIFNTCGPSENHIWICGCELLDDDITLGYPVRNTQIYIMDDKQNILPIGVPGELCVSGDCIGLGYLNRPELNKEKYVPHPFIKGKLLYRTGDLALIRPNGIIEHLGRIDTQVKIRGLRVELGEIESNICAFDGIADTAVVIVKHQGKEFLCGFYQAVKDVDETELKTTLSNILPNYMVPNLFIRLNSFPMTSSGKIARGVLEKYDISGLTEAEEYKAPTSELQKLLCREFEKLLKISPVSINLDFFSAGGNSIHVIEMLAHLPEDFQLSARDIYNHPTVESLAEYIESQAEKEFETVSRLVKGEDKQVIVCFPFAGSDDSTFIDLASALQKQLPTISVYALRHANWTEVDFSKAIEEVSRIIEEAESVLFYSHCAGSAMALKLYQHLSDNSKIKHIIMGGNVPPKGIKLYGKRLNPWKFMSDEKLLHTLQNVGMELEGMSDTVKAKLSKQFRIDTECYFREMALLDGVVPTPCTLIVSDADKFTPHIDKAQHAWQHYFKHPVDMVVIHGANHYFHTQRADEVATIILRQE